MSWDDTIEENLSWESILLWKSNPGACASCRNMNGSYIPNNANFELMRPHPNCKCGTELCDEGLELDEWEVVWEGPTLSYNYTILKSDRTGPALSIRWNRKYFVIEERMRKKVRICSDMRKVLEEKKKLEKGMNMKSDGPKGFATLGVGTQLNASIISSQIHGPIKERDTPLLQVNKIFLLFAMVVFFMATNCLAAENSLAPELFMGPGPGTIYYYKEKDSKRTMTLTGIRYDTKGNLHIKEVITPPSSEVLFKDAQAEESRYVFSIVGNRLTKQIPPEFGGVFVETYLDIGGESWGIPVTLHRTGEKAETVCNIVSRTKQMLFGEIRIVLEIRGKLCVPCKYASGIGLIEEAGMQLLRIEKQSSTKPESPS